MCTRRTFLCWVSCPCYSNMRPGSDSTMQEGGVREPRTVRPEQPKIVGCEEVHHLVCILIRLPSLPIATTDIIGRVSKDWLLRKVVVQCHSPVLNCQLNATADSTGWGNTVQTVLNRTRHGWTVTWMDSQCGWVCDG